MKRLSSIPSCGVIVTTYNNLGGLRSCLLGLSRQSRQPTRIYVADDGSTAETGEFVRGFKSDVEIVHVWHEDKGFRKSAIINKALSQATEDYIIFLDGDEVPHRRFVDDYLTFARPNEMSLGTRCGLLGFDGLLPKPPSLLKLLLLFASKRVINDSLALEVTPLSRFTGFLKGIRFPFPILQSASVRHVKGGNMAAWRCDIAAINGFDADFVGWGYEDYDFARRLSENGVALRQVRFRAICFHLEKGTKSPNSFNLKIFESSRPRFCVNGITRAAAAPL